MTARNGGGDRAALKRYAEAIGLWRSRFNTCEIATMLGLPECTVANWVANFRDVVHS